MPAGEGGLMQKSPWYAAGAVALLALAGILAWYALRGGSSGTSAQTAQELTNALSQTQAAATTSIPVASNPVTAATPTVNPVETTNPFGARANPSSNAYQNPFQ